MLGVLLSSTVLMLADGSQDPRFVSGADIGAGLDDTVTERMAVCGIDEIELERLINLPQDEFDQDFQGGWRPYGDQDGCERATADLILTYLLYSPHVDELGLLRWHAGQMMAAAGNYDGAIPLFLASKDDEATAWNAYVDGSVAFLKGDRDAIEAARVALLAFAPDEEEQAATRRFLEQNPNIRVPEGFITDPPNLPVIDRLRTCWGSNYQTAYRGQCDAPTDPAAHITRERLVPSPQACEFLERRLNRYIGEVRDGERAVIGADWLTSAGDRASLVALLNQDGRETGPDASFAMGYQRDFADAVSGLTEAEIDRFHAMLTSPGPIDCPDVPIDQAPFTNDLSGFMAWAEAQMINPEPGAPDGAQSLALSRPLVFDSGERVLVVESYTYTPIPLSRPPSSVLSFIVYRRDGGRWALEASMVIVRSG